MCVAVSGPLSSPLAEALRPLLEPLGQLLYDLLRPRFVQLADMDTLSELIDILQHEVRWGPGTEESRQREGPAGCGGFEGCWCCKHAAVAASISFGSHGRDCQLHTFKGPSPKKMAKLRACGLLSHSNALYSYALHAHR